MTNYLMVFGAHAMDHVPDEDMPAVDEAAHAVAHSSASPREGTRRPSTPACTCSLAVIVATNGKVTDGQYHDSGCCG
jgi:hypothetical protein